MNALIVMNPTAGRGRHKAFTEYICSAFKKHGYTCDAATTAAPLDAERIVHERAKDYQLIVCCGGDGTLNETVNGLGGLREHPPVAYLPAGTTNDFAASLGLSRNIRQAIRDVLSGRRKRLDIGRLNGRRFIYSASFGLFVKSSYATPQNVKNCLGKLAYYLECASELPSVQPYHMKVTDGTGNVHEDDYLFGVVSNSTSIGGFLHFRHHEVDLADGLHEVLLIRYPKNLSELQKTICSVLAGDYAAEGIDLFHTSYVQFECEDMPEWSLDGERYVPEKEIIIENIPSAVEFLVPEKPTISS